GRARGRRITDRRDGPDAELPRDLEGPGAPGEGRAGGRETVGVGSMAALLGAGLLRGRPRGRESASPDPRSLRRSLSFEASAGTGRGPRRPRGRLDERGARVRRFPRLDRGVPSGRKAPSGNGRDRRRRPRPRRSRSRPPRLTAPRRWEILSRPAENPPEGG